MMYQIVILAGGLGSRLGKLTIKTPKALIKINKKPFIDYQLKYLSNQGFKNVLICVGYLGYKIKKYVGNGKKFKLNIKFSTENSKLLGTAGCIRKAKSLLDENFFIIYGDTFLPVNFKNIQKNFKKKNSNAMITILKNNNNLDKSNVYLNGNKILYKKNSKLKKMNYVEYGASIFNKKLFLQKKYKKYNDLSDLFNVLSKKSKLDYLIVKKRFYEIGSVIGLKETKKYLSSKKHKL